MFDIEELQLRLSHVAASPPERLDLAESLTVHSPDGEYLGAVTRYRNKEAWCVGIAWPGTDQTVTAGTATALDGALGVITAGHAAVQKVTQAIEAQVKVNRDRAAQVEGQPEATRYVFGDQPQRHDGGSCWGGSDPCEHIAAQSGADVAAALGKLPYVAPTVDLDLPPVSGCPNPWHDSAPARKQGLCPECPSIRLPAPAVLDPRGDVVPLAGWPMSAPCGQCGAGPGESCDDDCVNAPADPVTAAPAVLDMATQPVDATPLRIVALAVLNHIADSPGLPIPSKWMDSEYQHLALHVASLGVEQIRNIAVAAEIDTAGLVVAVMHGIEQPE